MDQDNKMMKFADDTYLLVGPIHMSTTQAEFNNVSSWAARNNLKLNALKTKELIIHKRRSPRTPALPFQLYKGQRGYPRWRFSAWSLTPSKPWFDHLDHLLTSCASSVYALRMLKTHGLPQQQLNVVASATTMASLLYASPAWWGYTSANDRARIDRLINRLWREATSLWITTVLRN